MSERLSATPAGVVLCPLDLVADGAARNFVLQLRAGRFHGFVVRRDDRVHGYVDRCPHAGLPLAQQLDGYLTPDGDLIACSWHGALFRVDDGLCVGGPCVGQRLTSWPVAVNDGQIVTAAPAAAPDVLPSQREDHPMPETDKTAAANKANAEEIKRMDQLERGARGNILSEADADADQELPPADGPPPLPN